MHAWFSGDYGEMLMNQEPELRKQLPCHGHQLIGKSFAEKSSSKKSILGIPSHSQFSHKMYLLDSISWGCFRLVEKNKLQLTFSNLMPHQICILLGGKLLVKLSFRQPRKQNCVKLLNFVFVSHIISFNSLIFIKGKFHFVSSLLISCILIIRFNLLMCWFTSFTFTNSHWSKVISLFIIIIHSPL